MYNVGLNFQLNVLQVAGMWMAEAPACGTHSVMPKEGCLKTILEMWPVTAISSGKRT